ncbi:MAG: hypothetical protein EAZ08_04290 [Cytophagales bacterium]|nr:MAG: hypothetical protein EAZ08_04290 [Cytophagales bacterium]
MKKDKVSISFYLRDYKAQRKTAICVQFSFGKNRLQCTTGLSIAIEEWNMKKAYPKSQIADYDFYDGYLNKVKKHIVDYYNSQRAKGIIPLPSSIKAYLFEQMNQQEQAKPVEKTFFEYYDDFIDAKKPEVKYPTIQKYISLKHKLQSFEKEKKYPLDFDSISPLFESKFRSHCLEQRNTKYGNEGLLNDTVAKYFSCIKTFMQWSLDMKYHQNDLFKKFKATRASKHEIITLTEQEFYQLLNYDFSTNKRLERVRDLFCFMVFTLQRWSDTAAFNPKHIKNDVWDFISIKTNENILVPLNTTYTAGAKKVLQKYEHNLPKISEQKFNEYIKEACQIAGIQEEVSIRRYSGKQAFDIAKPKYEFISSHSARRTGITLLLQKGVPPTTIMKVTGHEDLKTLMKYENTSDDAVFNAFNKVNL